MHFLIVFFKNLMQKSALSAFFMVFVFNASAQNFSTIIQKTKRYQQFNHHEKLFLQTDRPTYVAGESVWFSAFLIDASSHQLNLSEKVMYVDLVSPKGDIIQKQLFSITQGKANGQIQLKNTLISGNYHLVAYTNWMRNGGSRFYFSKLIKVLPVDMQQNNTIAINQPAINTSAGKDVNVDSIYHNQLRVNFYPEGGHLIEGVGSKVAFEVLDEFKHPVKAHGMVLDDNGEMVTMANTSWMGKGYLMFTPMPERAYYLQLISTEGSAEKYKLPKAEPSGISLTIQEGEHPEQLYLMATSKGDLATFQSGFLLAMQNGTPINALTLNFKEQKTVAIAIDKADFKTGIVQFTVFNAHQSPCAERLYFIKKDDQLSVNIKEQKLPTAQRSLVELELQATDNNGNPVVGSFAVSITDANFLANSQYAAANIRQYFSLYADLPGYSAIDTEVFESSKAGNLKAELLMLTNGWRRYSWEEVLADTLELPVYFEEPGLYVKGKVQSKIRESKLPSDVEITMVTEGSRQELFVERVDHHGGFTFLLQDFVDTLQAVVQTKNKSKNLKDYNIELYTNYQQQSTDVYTHLTRIHSSTSQKQDTVDKNNLHLAAPELITALTRQLVEDTFAIKTDYYIPEVVIQKDRIRSKKEEMANTYGASNYSIGQQTIQQLDRDKPWNIGLMSILTTAFPNLYVETLSSTTEFDQYRGLLTSSEPSINGSNMIYSNDQSVIFQFKDRRTHRFFIFVDGEMVAATNAKGLLTSAFGAYSISDLINFDPKMVASIDLVFPKGVNAREELIAQSDFYAVGMNEYKGREEDLKTLVSEADKRLVPAAIFSIYTVDGAGLYSKKHNKGLAKMAVHGYTRVKEFYQPNYASDTIDTILQDFRKTLAWLPDVRTDSTGRAMFSFYTSDVSSKFRVEVNGLSSEGMPGAAFYLHDSALFSLSDYPVITKAESRSLPKIVLPKKKNAAYAIIKRLASEWYTFSDSDGMFSIDSQQVNSSDSLLIMKQGFNDTVLMLNKLDNGPIMLSEKKTDPSLEYGDWVMKNFHNRKFKNYNKGVDYYNGAYRELVMSGDALHQLTDYSFTQRFKPLNEEKAKLTTQLDGGARYRSHNFATQIPFTIKDRLDDVIPFMEPLYSEKSFLDFDFRKFYVFQLLGETSYQGRKVFHVQFDQTAEAKWALYKGQLFIDVETFELVWATWKISELGKQYVMPEEYLATGGDQQTFRLLNETNEFMCSFNGDQWVPLFAYAILQFEQKNKTYKALREIAWHPTAKVSDFKSSKPKGMNRKLSFQKTPSYTPTQWRRKYLLPANKTIAEQLKFLNFVVFYNK